MKFTIEWIADLKNPILNGLKPVIDPFDNHSLLISDGWGSSYASMKLRKISLHNGKELSSTYIKNSVRCVYYNSDGNTLIAVSDNKIFELDRESLNIITKHEKGIYKYGDFIASDNHGKYLIMNYRAGSLFVFDTKNGVGKRKKIGSCDGILRITNDTFNILLPFEGKIVTFDLKSEKITQKIEYQTFYQGFISNSGKLYLRSGMQHLEENTSSFIDPLDTIKIYEKIGSTSFKEICIPKEYKNFTVSPTEDKITFLCDDRIMFYSIVKDSIFGEIEIEEDYRIIKYFETSSTILIGNYKNNYQTIKYLKVDK